MKRFKSITTLMSARGKRKNDKRIDSKDVRT